MAALMAGAAPSFPGTEVGFNRFAPGQEEEGPQHPGVPRRAISQTACPHGVAALASSCATNQSLGAWPSPRCGWGLFPSEAPQEAPVQPA